MGAGLADPHLVFFLVCVNWLLFTSSSAVLGHSVQLYKEEEVGVAWHRWARCETCKAFICSPAKGTVAWGRGKYTHSAAEMWATEQVTFQRGKLDSILACPASRIYFCWFKLLLLSLLYLGLNKRVPAERGFCTSPNQLVRSPQEHPGAEHWPWEG